MPRFSSASSSPSTTERDGRVVEGLGERHLAREGAAPALVHDAEIKSHDTQVLQTCKELVDDCDEWDQIFAITFSESVLKAACHNHPEMS